jgi:hypothetical protein
MKYVATAPVTSHPHYTHVIITLKYEAKTKALEVALVM